MVDDRLRLSDGKEDVRRTTPWESLLLAYAAMAPLVAAAALVFVLSGDAAFLVAHWMVVWAGSVLCFLAGVRRGLSFRQEGGPLLTQLATMLWLFVLGAASLFSPSTPLSLALQVLGYATLAIADPLAARRGAAPRYFEALRPVQMALPIISLTAVLIRQIA